MSGPRLGIWVVGVWLTTSLGVAGCELLVGVDSSQVPLPTTPAAPDAAVDGSRDSAAEGGGRDTAGPRDAPATDQDAAAPPSIESGTEDAADSDGGPADVAEGDSSPDA